jgi:hypothetical protein
LPTGITLDPGIFDDVPTATLTSDIAAADDVSITVSFINSNPIPVDGKIVFEVPSSFTVPSGNLGSPADPSAALDGTLSVVGSSKTITITRSGDGSQISAGSSISLTIAGFTNPSVSGSTGVFPNLYTTDASNLKIDAATPSYNTDKQIQAITINPASFAGSNPAVTLASYSAGATAVDATLSFTLGSSPLPSDGKVVIEFPADFQIADGSYTVTENEEVDGGFSAQAGSNVITISRTGTGLSDLAGNTFISLTLVDILENPGVSVTVTAFPYLRTTTSDDKAINEASASYHSTSQIQGIVITPGQFSSAVTVTLDSYVAGQSTTARIGLPLSNPWPATGTLEIEFPSEPDISNPLGNASSRVPVAGHGLLNGKPILAVVLCPATYESSVTVTALLNCPGVITMPCI